MTSTEKQQKLSKISAAYMAGYITSEQYRAKSELVHKEFYDAQYGEFDPADLA